VFGIFLFLTYYLQLTLAYSPVKSGLAFLPMIAAIVVASTTSSGALMPRFGPRPLIPAGLLAAAGGLALLASQLGLHTSYLGWILPALLLMGAGLGLVFGCALNTATYGTAAADAGVASALVNTNQQVGGGVILGRAAAVVLGKDRGFHVRLDGPAARRVAQGAVVEGISEEEARERLRAADKARTAYVRRLYRCDPADLSLYHLVIDSTAIPLDTVIELIITAARAHMAPVHARSETH
jgi:cytidylate kinase